MFRKILIADRGEMAVRIIRTCRKMGIKSVAIYSKEEKLAVHAKMADESYCIGPADRHASYMNREGILTIAKAAGAEAIHPGYGFLSEDSSFAKLCTENNIVFIGPTFQTMEKSCDKFQMKQISKELSIPVAEAYGIQNQADLKALVTELGYPVMLKKKRSGGGHGNQLIKNSDELERFLSIYRNVDNSCYVEKFFPCARHIEVQILGDCSGKIHILGDRDCSVQIKNKKIIEESPAFSISEETRDILYEYAKKICYKIHYTNIGTVEFLVNREEIIFIEMNSRIQVEHGITEMVTGTDIVALQMKVAAKEETKLSDLIVPRGHAVECRINAETSGMIQSFSYSPKENTRFDHMLETHAVISPYYDSLLGKVIVWDMDRTNAVDKISHFLDDVSICGVQTNLEKLKQIVNHNSFIAGDYRTDFIPGMESMVYKKENPGVREKIQRIVDKGSFQELFSNLVANNCIQFEGYDEKLVQARKKTGEMEAVIIGRALVDGIPCMLIMMNPDFIMGSMGLAAGEKITRAFEAAADSNLPVVSVAASGGARVQEGIFSLFQMAKTADAVKRHGDKGLLYLSIISNPTLGGVSASFASLGDIIFMEEDAVYGFTGKRIVEETVGKKMPKDFQTAAFQLENGHIDRMIKKVNLKYEIGRILKMHRNETKMLEKDDYEKQTVSSK